MNLINKKLRDKLQLLDDIDKQYLSSIKKRQNNEVNENNKINNLNSIDMLKKTNYENFDKIYSDFFANDVNFSFYENNLNKKNYSMSNNNCDKIPTNENSGEKDKNESFSQNEFMKNISPEKNIYNKNEQQSQNYINDDELEIGDRLNNYGKILKSKIDNIRQREYIKMKQRMIPRILPRSKSITRNKKNVIERLYFDYKRNSANNKDKKNNSGNHSTNLSNSNFTYHPKLNKKSILMAKKLEPSFIRINKKKNVKEIEKKPQNYYLNLFGNPNPLLNNKQNQNNNLSFYKDNKNKNKNNKNIYETINNLYLRGMEQKQNMEKKVKDREKKKQNEYKKYSFKPKLNKNILFDKKTGIKNNIPNKKNNLKKKNF